VNVTWLSVWQGSLAGHSLLLICAFIMHMVFGLASFVTCFCCVVAFGLVQVGKLPSSLCWGPSAQLLAASCGDGLHLCTHALLHHKLCEGYAVIQVGPVSCHEQ
jgi:hypothetical protein